MTFQQEDALSLSLCLFILSVFDGRELHLQFPVL